MLYMMIEHFRPGQAAAVYRRFRDRGRPSRTSEEAARAIAPEL